MLAITKKRASKQWRSALVYLALFGIAPFAYETSQADERTITGSAIVDVDSYEIDGVRYWDSELGDDDIVNAGDNSLGFSLTTDDESAGMRFANNARLEAGTLTIDPTVVAGTTRQINNVEYAGTTGGEGGLRIDVGSGATFKATGELGHAFTDVNTGTLDLSGAKGEQIDVGALSSDGAGVVYVGGKDLLVDVASPDDVVFNGTLIGDEVGANVDKNGTGAWTMNLTNDSKVASVDVNEGVFSLGKNHYDDGVFPSNDFAIALGENGTFKMDSGVGATMTLKNFDASKGGAINIAEDDEIVLSSSNASTNIAAGLYGDGYLTLENVKDEEGVVKPWILSGDNSNWNGTISAYGHYAAITLANENSGAANGTINFGSNAKLNVQETTTLGSLNFDDNLTLNVTNGKTFTLEKLLSSSIEYLDVSVTTLTGGGTVKLAEGAAKTYYGATLVKDGSTLYVVGDNAVAGTKRFETTLTNGGALALDYSVSDATKSIWGGDVNIDGEGAILVKGKGATDEIELNDAIAFVGDASNELVFTTDDASVLLRNNVEGIGNLRKNGNGTLILDGVGVFKDVSVYRGELRLGTEKNVNSQLANSDVLIDGGSLTGWFDSFGSITLVDGSLKTSGANTIALTSSGSAFSMSGGTVYVDVQASDSEKGYVNTNFKTTDENATVVVDGGVFSVSTNGLELADDATLTVIETGVGNLTADASKITIYDDIERKRFVVDSNALAEGKFNLILKALTFSDYAQTANQRNAASYLDKWVDCGYDPSLNDFFKALENNVAENPAALDQTTGEMRFSAMHAQLQTRNMIRQTLTREVLPSVSNGGVYSSAIRGQTETYSDEIGLNGWMSGIGASGDVGERAGASGYDYSMLGGVWGVELGSSLSNQLGFYYSYSSTEADSKTALGDAKINDNLFGLYLRASDDLGYTLATGSIGSASYKYNRVIALQGYDLQSFKGKTDGWSGGAYLERGLTFNLPLAQLQPFGGLQYAYLRADAFNESGSLNPIALSTDVNDYNSLQGLVGIRLLRSSPLAYGSFEWNVYVNWTHEYLDPNAEGTVAMIGGPDGKYHIIGNGAGRDWIYAGAGATAVLSQTFDLFGGCDVQTNKYVSLVNGNVGMRLKW